jgi:hypothetical protein
MILLSDNDILLKLAICDLLNETIVELGAAHGEVFVVGTARFKLGIAKNPDKTKAKFGEAVFARLKSFLNRVRTLDAPSPAELQVFDDIIGIDAGEAVLFAASAQFADFRLATGDKNSLKALVANPSCQTVCDRLSGKVVCFEQIILHLIGRYGFVPILNKVVPARGCDTALRAVFGSGLDATEENVRAGLASDYTLQWGHSLSAVENDARANRLRRDGKSFNGATAFRPWRTGSRSRWFVLPACFNGATAFRPWRTGRRADGGWGHVAASMGPQPFGRGERRIDGGFDECIPGFNGATAFRPWRTPLCILRTNRWLRASMGPQPFGRGELPGEHAGEDRQ